MTRATLFLLWMLSVVWPAQAQTAADLNEGLRVMPGTTAGDFTLTWWGRPGRTYFIQQSFDLMEWNWVPAVESGSGAVGGMNFACSEERQFWRLVHTDAPTGGNALTADFDGDGISNADEVSAAYGTNPFLRDSDWDGASDLAEAIAGTDSNSSQSSPAASPPGPGPLNPDSSYRNGLRLAYACQGMNVHYNGATSSAWAAHVTANGPNFFYPQTSQEPEDLTQEVSTLYEGASFLTPDQYLFQTSSSFWLTPSQWEIASGAEVTSKNTLRHRIELQAQASPAAPGDASRTLVAFYYEGGNAAEHLKEVGTITLSQLNVSCSGGIGSHCQIIGNKVVIEPKLDPNPKDFDPDPANTYTLQNLSLHLMDVDIEPDTGMAGVVGDVVKSARTGSRIRHFVTPKKSAELPQNYVEFTALGVSETSFDDLFEWQGGEPGSAANKRKVKRDATGMTQLQIKTKRDQLVVDEMRVWVVWCDSKVIGTIQPKTSVANQPPIGAVTTVSGGLQFTHTINPSEITEDTAERPKLEGAKSEDPPGGQHPLFGTDLKDGANNKWDASRQFRFKHANPNNLPIDAFGQPAPLVTILTFPANHVEGNDDANVSDEVPMPGGQPSGVANNPYQQTAKGILWSTDVPTFSIAKGNVDDTYEFNLQLQEFARLEINGTWYRIGDFKPWRFRVFMRKVHHVEMNIDYWGLDSQQQSPAVIQDNHNDF